MEKTKQAPEKKRLLGLDYGTKRIGVAVSDEAAQFALPNTVIENTPDLIREIEKITLDYEIKEIVLGESKNLKGEPNIIFDQTIAFKNQLESLGFVVHFEPEFFTSVQAEKFQGKIDSLDASAAALILQSFLDRRNSL